MIKFTTKPINKRISGEPKEYEGSMGKSVACILPVAIYYFLSVFLTYGAALLIGTGQYGTKTSNFAAEHSMGVSSAIRIAVVIIAVLPLIPGFMGEKIVIFQEKKHGENPGKGPKENRDEKNKKNREKEIGDRRTLIYGICVVLLAGALALFLNVIFSRIGVTSSSEEFSNTAAKQMSFPLSLGLLVYGIATPITEEIVYRGLVYNRLRRFYGFPIAAVTAPLLFGIAHGNLVQLLYGFIMGVVICLIYERLGSFSYVCLFHIVANSTVYIIMKNAAMKNAVASVPGVIVEGLMCLAAGAVIFSAFDKCGD